MQLGVCYYPEQWPRSMWADDAKRMVELGITHVRIAEFAWSRMEPRAGEFNWGWLDEAVQTLAAAGLKLVLGTPTASPPKWLIDAHPDVLPVRADGVRWNFGSRRHYDISSETYRRECVRIVTAMVERYGRHPSIVAWQTDNELGCHETVPSYSSAALARFQMWLQHRYERVEALNDAWGNVFWSMEYPSFETIGLPNLTPTDANPIHLLDFRRFMSDEVASFHREQIDVLRQHAPEADLLHNFMGFFTTFDHYRFAEDNAIDVAAWDSYPIARTESIALPEEQKARYARTAHPDVSAFDHDRYRAIGAGRFWVMEQQAGPVNWAPWNPVPAKGMVRLWAYEAFAHGAELVSYFRWRQCPYAQEQMHSGLNLPNNELSPGGLEVQQAAREIASSAALSGLGAPARAATAVVFDYETQWMFEIQRHGKTFDYQTLAFDYYEALRELGLDVDIVSSKADLSPYRLVVVPSIAVIDDTLVDQIEREFGAMGIRSEERFEDHDLCHSFELAARRVATRSADAGARSRNAASDAYASAFDRRHAGRCAALARARSRQWRDNRRRAIRRHVARDPHPRKGSLCGGLVIARVASRGFAASREAGGHRDATPG